MFALILFTIYESLLFPHSLFHEGNFNPAILSNHKIGIVCQINSCFNLPGVRTYAIQTHFREFGFDFKSFGDSLYKENQAAATMGFRITKGFTAGFSARLLNYWVRELYSRFGYSLGGGALYTNASYRIGIWIHNINRPKFSEIDYLPIVYSITSSYAVHSKLKFLFAVRGLEKELPFYNFGLSFSPLRETTLGIAVNTDPMYLECTCGFVMGTFLFHYQGKNSRYLGLSHCFGVGYQL